METTANGVSARHNPRSEDRINNGCVNCDDLLPRILCRWITAHKESRENPHIISQFIRGRFRSVPWTRSVDTG